MENHACLKQLLEKHKFKQIRFIEWIKTNPQHLNSKTNYLTNCREIALLAVKGGKPTNSGSYDNAIYNETVISNYLDCSYDVIHTSHRLLAKYFTVLYNTENIDFIQLKNHYLYLKR